MTWPASLEGSRLTTLGAIAATSKGTAVISSASLNTKGAWVEFSASAPFDADGFYVNAALSNVAVGDLLLDVGVGAAGSEQVILENVLMSVAGALVFSNFFVPLPIKAGERIAVRVQSSDASQSVQVTLQPVAGGFFSGLGLGRATTYGANTATSGGVQVDPGATINTKGAWAQISAAITNPIRYALICVGSRNNGVIGANHEMLIDIGVGAAASEQVIADDMYTFGSAALDMYMPQHFGRAISVKAGERISARCQASNNDATDRLVDLIVIGFD